MKLRSLFILLFVVPVLIYPQSGHEVKIAAVGDIMMGTLYPDSSTLPAKGSYHLFQPLIHALKDADITFGNLEGTLTNDTSQAKSCKNKDRCYYFAMPVSYAKSLQHAGFDFISLANNHINDFGYKGKLSTKKSLRKYNIKYAGLSEHPVDTIIRNGIRYGFCAFSPNAGTTNIKNLKKAISIISHLDSLCDIVIVSFHAGGEGTDFQHVTRETEFYIGENRGNVYEFAHKIIDAGGDVLLGHGPHVVRGVEIYHNKFISYSMGNFLTYSCVNVAGICGVAPLFHIYTDNKGNFLKAQIISTYQKKFQAPKIDKKNKAGNLIRQLTFTDFPEMKKIITITDDGWINKL
ncbi:MAG: CapA family protein [Paludibacter sp.]|nr:CapA family protein [Paludibacter sp.]